jgi:ABC-2 type transport system ATP-binding protein
LRVRGTTSATLTKRLYESPLVKKVNVIEEKDERLTLRIFPKSGGKTEALPQAVGEAAQGCRVELLEIEEGRLDEVFRSITLSDTAKEVAK